MIAFSFLDTFSLAASEIQVHVKNPYLKLTLQAEKMQQERYCNFTNSCFIKGLSRLKRKLCPDAG